MTSNFNRLITTIGSDGDQALLGIYPLNTLEDVLVTVQPPVRPRRGPGDIVLVIDTSPSMHASAPAQAATAMPTQEDARVTFLDLAKYAAQAIVSTMGDHDRLGIVTFGNGVHIRQKLEPMTQAGKEKAKSNIERIEDDTQSALWLGIVEGLKLFESGNTKGGNSSLLVFTAGQPNLHAPFGGYVNELRSRGPLPAIIDTFGFGQKCQSDLLKSIAETGHGNYAFVPDAGAIKAVLSHAVARRQCTYAISSTVKITAPEGLFLEEETITQAERELRCGVIDDPNVTVQLGHLYYGQARGIINLKVVNLYASVKLRQGAPPPFPDKRVMTANLTFSRLSSPDKEVTVSHDLLVPPDRAQKEKAMRDTGSSLYNDNPLFIECRNALQAAFDNTPPPQPRVQEHKTNREIHRSGGKWGAKRIDEDGNSNTVCFSGDSCVLLDTGEEKRIDQLTKGVMVQTPKGPRRVVAMLSTVATAKRMYVCKEATITPWHPIRIDGSNEGTSSQSPWVFPKHVTQEKTKYSGKIWSVLLEPDENVDAHAIRIGGIWGVTLGHGILSGNELVFFESFIP
ncbi:von Willebrand factor type A domain-containing protein [Astrocystis sublimbata]|nr:von Willebrand factor type A domain-containing protein [Astrocystis sublimbata]